MRNNIWHLLRLKNVFWALFFDHSWLNLLKTTAEKQISEQALCSSCQAPHAVGWFSLPGSSSSPPQPPSLHPQFRARKRAHGTEIYTGLCYQVSACPPLVGIVSLGFGTPQNAPHHHQLGPVSCTFVSKRLQCHSLHLRSCEELNYFFTRTLNPREDVATDRKYSFLFSGVVCFLKRSQNLSRAE